MYSNSTAVADGISETSYFFCLCLGDSFSNVPPAGPSFLVGTKSKLFFLTGVVETSVEASVHVQTKRTRR